jgi:hypothetical protein
MTKSTVLVVLAVVLAPTLARADDARDTVLQTVNPMLNWLQAMRTEAAATEGATKASASECHAAVAAGKKAGLAGDAKLYANGIYALGDEHYDDKHEPYITLDEADALCTEYGKWLLIGPAAAAQAYALQVLKQYTSMTAENEMKGTDQTLIETGTACLTKTDAAIKAGAPGDWTTTIYGEQLTLAQGRAKACEGLVALGKSWTGKAGKADAEKLAKIRDKYAALGIKGARLDLYVETDNTYWLGKGCEKITDNKKLKNAKVLFQWWDNSDGTITIRKYTFAGDKVKSIKNNVFQTQERASRGCK